MDQSINRSHTIPLTRDHLARADVAFEPRGGDSGQLNQVAELLAASFMKYSVYARELMSQDSVDNFIRLNQYHHGLLKDAREFLQVRQFSLSEGKLSIKPLLLAFGSFRLKQSLEKYSQSILDSSCTREPGTERALWQEASRDFENLLNSL